MPELRLAAPIARRWPGQTIVCAASGPTLTADDLARVRGQAPVVAVNDAIRLAPWADVLYSSDRAWWRHYRGVPAYQGQRVGIGVRVGDASPLVAVPAVHVLTYTGVDGLEPDPTGLRSGQHSGYAAINLAVHLGATRIVLLGYTGGPVAGRSHFFGRHPSGLSESTAAHYDTFNRRYHTLIAPLQAAGITVINATPETRITAFWTATLETALAAEVLTC